MHCSPMLILMNCSYFSMLSFKVMQVREFLLQKNLSLFSKKLLHGKGVRVRFAPSPTGFLHIGGLRTALYNYLFARKHKDGKFIIRIEDTDQARIVAGSKEKLISSLEWAGIVPDESFVHGGNYGPYIQSERLHHYKRHADELVSSGAAYHCFCSNQRLALLKKDQQQRREMPRYDNRCRSLSAEEVNSHLCHGKSSVIRMKIPSGIQHIADNLIGGVTHDITKSEGDPVLLKTDGYPTYHLANVVDDHLMAITHVIRGKEWLISTFKHSVLYKAFGWSEPVYIHLPLLVNKDKKKLSKRQGEVFVDQYRDAGYSAPALLNFLAAYGSGFRDLSLPVGGDNCVQVMEALIHAFDPQKLVASDATVEFPKLDHFSAVLTAQAIDNLASKKQMATDLYQMLVTKHDGNLLFGSDEPITSIAQNYIEHVLEVRKTHIVKLNDLAGDEYSFLWVRPIAIVAEEDVQFAAMLQEFRNHVAELNWTKSSLDMQSFFKNLAETHNLRFPTQMTFLRKTLSGLPRGPSVVEIMSMLSKRESLRRIDSTLELLTKMKSSRGKSIPET